MSDSEDSTVTYTAVSSLFEGLSDIGSPRVNGLPMMPEDPYAYVVAAFQAPPSPDYVPGPEEPEQAPPVLEFIPEPVYPEFMPPEDDVLLAEEQPLPAAVSPIADSPGYIPESDPEDDQKEYDDEDPEEDPIDYPTDGGDDGDDEDESSDDDEDDYDVEEDEEEHLAPADSIAVAFLAVEHVSSAEETEPFETDESVATPPPHLAYCVTARMSVRAQTPISLPSDTKVARLLAIPTPPSLPQSPWSSPLPQIPSPPLPIPPPLPVPSPPLPISPTYPLGYRAAMIRLRVDAPSTSYLLPPPPPIMLLHTRISMAMMRAAAPSTYTLAPRSKTPPSGTPPLLPIPLPTPSPPFLLPFTDCREGVSQVTLPPRKRLCIALGPRYEVGESLSAPTARHTRGFREDCGFIATLDEEIRRDLERYVGYGITDTWDEMLEDMPGAPVTDDTKLGRQMTEFATMVRQDTYEMHVKLDDAQSDMLLMSGQLNMLYRDRHAHARTALLMEAEARLSQEAWRRSMDTSDLARSKVMALRTQAEMVALRAADCTRQAQLVEALRLVSSLQTQVTALQGQQGPARGPAQPNIPEEAGSSS
ncbi:hypothetical protein Tco_0913928 [Tanacetum coccineum]